MELRGLTAGGECPERTYEEIEAEKHEVSRALFWPLDWAPVLLPEATCAPSWEFVESGSARGSQLTPMSYNYLRPRPKSGPAQGSRSQSLRELKA